MFMLCFICSPTQATLAAVLSTFTAMTRWNWFCLTLRKMLFTERPMMWSAWILSWSTRAVLATSRYRKFNGIFLYGWHQVVFYSHCNLQSVLNIFTNWTQLFKQWTQDIFNCYSLNNRMKWNEMISSCLFVNPFVLTVQWFWHAYLCLVSCLAFLGYFLELAPSPSHIVSWLEHK